MRIFVILIMLSGLPLVAGAEDLAEWADALPNGRLIGPSVISAGQPDAAQLQNLAGVGLAAVINLRTPGEDPGFDEAEVLRSEDVAYYHVPVAGSAGLSPENVQRLDRLLARHAGQPVLVHCASGNRVGALFALRAHWLQGAEADSALAEGRSAGMTRLEGAVEALLGDE